MATEFVCPACSVTARSGKTIAAGTSVKCPSCGHVFPLGTSSASRPAPPKPAPRPSEVVTARRDPDPPPPPRRAERDEDYDDGPRRPRRRRPAKSGGGNAVVMGLVAVVAVLLIGVGAFAIFAFTSGKKTTQQQAAFNPPPQYDTQPNRPTRPTGFAPAPSAPPTQPAFRPPPDTRPSGSDSFPEPSRPSGGRSDPPEMSPPGDGSSEDAGPVDVAPVVDPASEFHALIPPPPAKKTSGEPPAAVLQLPGDVLSKVKKATVLIRVSSAEGEGSGSGFFAVGAKEMVLTNAHVIGMLSPDSPPPKKIEIVMNSGEPNEAVFGGEILAVDRKSDLSVLKLVRNDKTKTTALPEPLAVAGYPIQETQVVFIAGFPLGESLGKNITVAGSSVSSLRKTPEGEMDQVQVNGGMHPGNSGGPVVDAAGNIVGVSVSGIRGTQLNFAIPSERVSAILDGRLQGIRTSDAVRRNGTYSVAVEVLALDPLAQVKGLALDWWWGDPAQKVSAGRGTQPAQPSGTAARQTVAATKSGAFGRYTAELRVGTTIPANKVLWVQPHYANASEKDLYTQGVSREIEPPPTRKIIALGYHPTAGTSAIDLKSTNRLTLRASDSESHTLYINIETPMTEEMTYAPDGQSVFQRLRFVKEKFAVGLLEDDKPIRSRGDELQKAVQNIGTVTIERQINPNGNVMKGRSEYNAPPEVHAILRRWTRQVGHSMDLASIAFPNAPQLAPGTSWVSDRLLPLGLAGDDDLSAQVPIRYTYRGTRKVNGKEMAVIAMQGRIMTRGKEGGLNGVANGTALVDLLNGRVGKVNMTVESTLAVRIPEIGSGTMQARSRLDIRMTRQ